MVCPLPPLFRTELFCINIIYGGLSEKIANLIREPSLFFLLVRLKVPRDLPFFFFLNLLFIVVSTFDQGHFST